MLIGDIPDTLNNIVTFTFIGVLIWVAMRKLPPRDDKPDRDDEDLG